jgi:hypothetical protein
MLCGVGCLPIGRFFPTAGCSYQQTFLRYQITLDQKTDRFFGSYGYAEWATDAFGVHLVRCDELGGLEDYQRVKAHIMEHQRKFPTQPLVVVAHSQDIEHHLEAYVVINQPRYELPDWLTTCAEDIMSWLLLWPREYEDASSHAGAREDGTFMVDTVIGWRFAESGTKEFLVRWVGWEDCTWEPQDNVPPALWLEGDW